MAAVEKIQNRAFISVLWGFVNKFGTQILAIVPAMVLARLVTPRDYGLIAMAGIFSGLVSIFVDSGFGMAVIQKKNLSHVDTCSVFYFNIVISSVVYAILYIAAPYVADFFNMPEVSAILRVSSISIVIGAFGSIHGHLFSKNLDFKHPTIRNLSAQVIAALVAIAIALGGFGYWALVFQSMVSTLFSTLINWFYSPWRPTLVFSLESLKSMFGFGSSMLGKSISDFGFGKVYDLVIGKFYSAADLSYFNRAYATVSLFLDTFLGVINNIAFPVFSKMQDDKVRMRTNVLRFLYIESMIMFFIMLLAASLSTPLFHFLYSSKWNAVIPLFQILCLWGLLKPISVIFANGLMASGKSKVCLRNSFIGRGLNVLFLVVTWRFGLEMMIVGQIVAFFLEVLLYIQAFNKEFKYGLVDLVKDLWPYLLIAVLVSGSVYVFDRYLMASWTYLLISEIVESLFRLSIGVLLGIFLFVIVNRMLKLKAYCDFKMIVIDATKNKAKVNNWVIKIL